MAFALLLVIGFVSFVIYKYLLYLYRYRGMPPYNREGYVPVLGHLIHITWSMFTMDVQQQTIKNKNFGSISTTWLPGNPVVGVLDFKLAKEMTVTRGDVFSGRPRMAFHDMMPLGRNSSGIIHTNGAVWRHNRRTSLTWLRNFGLRKNLMEQQINAQIDKMMAWLQDDQEVAKTNNQLAIVSFELPLKYCISSIIANIALGVSYDRGDQKYLELQAALNDVFDVYMSFRGVMFMFFPFLKNIPLFGHCGYDKLVEIGRPLIQYYESEIATIKANFQPNSEPANLVEAFLAEAEDEKKKGVIPSMNHTQIMGVLGDLWAAGMETTANTMLWLLLYMMNFPYVQERVFQEIKDCCGMERRPQLGDQKQMTFVVAVINEVQRLANILPNAVVHCANQDTELAGYRIPAGVTVVYSTMTIHLDPKVFPEPETFRPERFLEEDGKTLRKFEEFIPFGMGKRVCPGESMARMELFLIFTAIIQRFKVEVVPGEEMPTLKHKLKGTLGTHPYKALLTARVE